MEKLIVKGEKPLSGTIGVSGSKNATLAILAATILSNKKIILKVNLIKLLKYLITNFSFCRLPRLLKS